MKTDAEIKLDGTKALLDSLGEVDTERYISLLRREPFDYTQWQQKLLATSSLEAISKAAMKAREKAS